MYLTGFPIKLHCEIVSAIVRTQRLTVADAVPIKKPQRCYKLKCPSDQTALCTLIDVTTVALDINIPSVLTYFYKM